MIDLRSDTVTRPTVAMRQAMATALVGDDVYGDDPTVNELEALAARMTGKEAALFVCSGTMGNQLAIMSHTRPGEELIAAKDSHVIVHECGGHARLSGLSAALCQETRGVSAEAVRMLVRDGEDIHNPITSLLCLENALGDGSVVPLDDMNGAAQTAHALGLKVHLDGARLYNAAVALGVSAAELVREVDSVMFCLSKGLCAPVGSMLCGCGELIKRARRNRKVLGGGLRQAGVLAACGLLSLQQMTGRLQEDHDNATWLAGQLSDIPGIVVDKDRVQINMVFFDVVKEGFADKAFVQFMKDKGVLINGSSKHHYRFVTHHDVGREALGRAVTAVKAYVLG